MDSSGTVVVALELVPTSKSLLDSDIFEGYRATRHIAFPSDDTANQVKTIRGGGESTWGVQASEVPFLLWAHVGSQGVWIEAKGSKMGARLNDTL